MSETTVEIHEGDSGGNAIAWEQACTILQGFCGSNAPETVHGGDLADDDIVMRAVNEVEFTVLNDGGVTGFISSA